MFAGQSSDEVKLKSSCCKIRGKNFSVVYFELGLGAAHFKYSTNSAFFNFCKILMQKMMDNEAKSNIF